MVAPLLAAVCLIVIMGALVVLFVPKASFRALRKPAIGALAVGFIGYVSSGALQSGARPNQEATHSDAPSADVRARGVPSPAASHIATQASAPVAKAESWPKVTVDASLLPVLNVNIAYPTTTFVPDQVVSVSEGVDQAARMIDGASSQVRRATAVNFYAVGGPGKVMMLHFTIPTTELLRARHDGKAAPYYLTLTREAGANSIDVEHAVRDYCQGTNIAFCRQIVD